MRVETSCCAFVNGETYHETEGALEADGRPVNVVGREILDFKQWASHIRRYVIVMDKIPYVILIK